MDKKIKAISKTGRGFSCKNRSIETQKKIYKEYVLKEMILCKGKASFAV